MNLIEESKSFAPVLTRIGSELMKLRESGDMGAREKTSQWDIVTAADKLSEQMLLEHIQSRYPSDGITGEEGSNVPGRSGRGWYLDPIDGTSNFERGSDFWGISAGLEAEGIPIFGIIHYPALEKTLVAAYAQGTEFVGADGTTQRFPKRTRPPAATLRKASVITNLYPGKEHLFGVIRQHVQLTNMFNSVVFDILQLVRGQVDAMFHTGATPFDIAAGIVIARECGFTVSGVSSKKIDLSRPRIPIIMARNEHLCDELREILASHLS